MRMRSRPAQSQPYAWPRNCLLAWRKMAEDWWVGSVVPDASCWSSSSWIYLDPLSPCPAGRLCGLQQSKLGPRAELTLLCIMGANLFAAEWNSVLGRILDLGSCVSHVREQFSSSPEPCWGLLTLEYWRSESTLQVVARSIVLRSSWVPGWDLALLPRVEKHSRYFSPINTSLGHKPQFGTASIAKSTHLLILTLSVKTENSVHSRYTTCSPPHQQQPSLLPWLGYISAPKSGPSK